MRVLALAVLTVALTAAEGYRFRVGDLRLYQYRLQQEVAWESAGDRLVYTSDLEWRYALRVAAVAGDEAELAVTVTRVIATHRGPGSEHAIDSADAGAGSDPVLGHLAALEGSTIRLTVNALTGRVRTAAVDEGLFQRINARFPARSPVDPPPFDAAARKLYAPEALAAWWTAILALPSAEPLELPLAPPLEGRVVRTWTGDRWSLALPAGASELPIRLLSDPTPVDGVLTALTGSGSLALADGLPGAGTGEASFTLRLTALTQGVAQTHRLTWRLTPAGASTAPAPAPEPTPAPEGGK